jgi:hypothetical protein
VIPELLEDTKLWQTVKEIVAMITGVLMMVIIATWNSNFGHLGYFHVVTS